ncbi:MAG: hypothetical protein KC478_15210 [Bacteriovoracaceae bacterium]|nr:hypothetical protein [Bacteriovoracaceae bacterium]
MFKAYQLLRLFYYPFFNWIFPLVFRPIRERLLFEKTNISDQSSRSFKPDDIEADLCFEVSSEGELEQVRPVLMHALSLGQTVELIFSSDSVQKQCTSLAQNYPEQLRILRYPLLSYFPARAWSDPIKWISAKKLFLCRYDFFPELLRYGRKDDVEFILLSASLKSYGNKGALSKAFYNFVYNSFDKIVTATDLDLQRFQDYFNTSSERAQSFDFRPLAIDARQINAEAVLSEKFPNYTEFKELISSYEKRHRLIFGSFWAYELPAFSQGYDFDKNLLCLAPHKLDTDSIEEIKNGLREKFPNSPVYEWSSDESANKLVLDRFNQSPGPIIINLKGVLCELYTLFGGAFVGGGHGISVHSLLEPFMGECAVYCGPKVHRSTEYDLILQNNPDRLRIVDRLENVVENFEKDISIRILINWAGRLVR